MNRFAQLLDRLAYEPARNNKLRLMTAYVRDTPDPERGWALAALTGALTFQHAKPNIIRALIAERTDQVLFALSYDYVGDLSETVALMWPTPQGSVSSQRARLLPPPPCGEGRGGGRATNTDLDVSTRGTTPTPDPSPQGGGEQAVPVTKATPTLSEVVTTLATLGKSELPA